MSEQQKMEIKKERKPRKVKEYEIGNMDDLDFDYTNSAKTEKTRKKRAEADARPRY